MRAQLTKLLALLLLSSAAPALAGTWQVDSDASSINFTSVKNKTITEHHQFTRVSGDIKPSGKLELRIDLHAVETKIPIRNERMQKLLFTGAREAVFTAELGRDFEESGAPIRAVSGTLSLNGVTKPLSFVVEVTQTSGRQVAIKSVHPVIIDAARYNLLPGIEALRDIAGLMGIKQTVPVTFALRLLRR